MYGHKTKNFEDSSLLYPLNRIIVLGSPLGPMTYPVMSSLPS